MHLIVNADDLGYSPGVNEAIVGLYRIGRLSCTSVIVNLPHSAAGIAAARAEGLPVGVHLNLTRGRPCLPAGEVPSLVTNEGRFYPSPTFFVRAAAGLVRPAEVEAECRAQIEHALAGLGRIAHLDSHSHWQMVPALRAVLERLAQETGVARVRTTDARRSLYPNALWLAFATTKPAAPSRPSRSDYLLSLHHWLDEAGRPSPWLASERFRALVARPEVTLELVTHPGRAADPDFPADTLPAAMRQQEVDFLSSPAFARWLADAGGDII
jgi:predicted glycoside hydrolase/deacetylase ChbG (UPF0249 family)